GEGGLALRRARVLPTALAPYVLCRRRGGGGKRRYVFRRTAPAPPQLPQSRASPGAREAALGDEQPARLREPQGLRGQRALPAGRLHQGSERPLRCDNAKISRGYPVRGGRE